jgi:hypothetical protein
MTIAVGIVVTSADRLALKKYNQRNSDGRMTFERTRVFDPPWFKATDHPLPMAAEDKLTPDPVLSETAHAIRTTHMYEEDVATAPDVEFNWSPMELNPIAWWDPTHQDDTNPLGVTTIQDRSGNGHHAVWTGPRNDFDGHPVGKVVPTTNTPSGHAAWFLEETIPLVHRPYQTNIPSLPTARTYYAVVWNVQPNEGDSCLFGPGMDWTDRRGGTEIVLARRNDPQPLVTPFWSFYFAEDTDPGTPPHNYHWSDSSGERNGSWQGVWGVTVQRANQSGGVGMWHYNGVTYAFRKENIHAQICIGNPCDGDTGKNLMLFSSRQRDYPVVGIVGDIIICTEQALPNQQKLEGYLAWKYSMQHLLSSNQQVAYGPSAQGHPYRWAPP